MFTKKQNAVAMFFFRNARLNAEATLSIAFLRQNLQDTVQQQ